MAQAEKEAEVPASVSKMVRAVLLSSRKGVPLKKFSRDYVNLVGEHFPWRKLGFSSAISLLKAMPSVVRFEFSHKDGDYRLYGIGDDHMFMPSWVIKAQGKMSHSDIPSMKSELDTPILNSTPLSPNDTTTSKPTVISGCSSRELVYNARGLVTIYVSWCDSATKKSANSCDTKTMANILSDLVLEVADPIEVSVRTNSSAFVRFSSIEEGERVICQLNKSEYCGYKFLMMPATEKMPKGRVKPTCCKSKKEIQYKLQEAVRKQNILRQSKDLKSAGALLCSNGRSTDSMELPNSKQHNSMAQKHFYNLIDDMAFSECGSDDSSSFEWDYDLLDNPLTTSPVNNHCDALCDEQTSCDEAQHCTSRSEFNQYGLLPVTISQVNSPDNLWIQLTRDPKAECARLSTRISCSKPTRLDKCQIGSFCCVRDSQVFMRTRVEDILTSAVHNQVNVLYIDTGEIRVVPQEHVYTLPSNVDIQLVPPLAIPCSLHGIVSTHCNGESWYPLDMQLLWKHLYHKKVYAKIIKRTSTLHSTEQRQNVGVVDLYFDPFGLQNVAQTLVEEGIHFDCALPGSECSTGSKRSEGSSCRNDGASLKDEETLSEHSPAAPTRGGKTSPWKRLQTVYDIVS